MGFHSYRIRQILYQMVLQEGKIFKKRFNLQGEPTIRPPVLPYCQLSDGEQKHFVT